MSVYARGLGLDVRGETGPIATRVTALVRKVGIADKFVITGGVGRTVGLVSQIEQRLDG